MNTASRILLHTGSKDLDGFGQAQKDNVQYLLAVMPNIGKGLEVAASVFQLAASAPEGYRLAGERPDANKITGFIIQYYVTGGVVSADCHSEAFHLDLALVNRSERAGGTEEGDTG